MKDDAQNAKDPIDRNEVMTKMQEALKRNSGYLLNKYHINQDSVNADVILDMCKIQNNGCQHTCSFDYKSADFVCGCPEGHFLNLDEKTCSMQADPSDDILPDFGFDQGMHEDYHEQDQYNSDHHDHDHNHEHHNHDQHNHNHQNYDHQNHDHSNHDHPNHDQHNHDHHNHEHHVHEYSTHEHHDQYPNNHDQNHNPDHYNQDHYNQNYGHHQHDHDNHDHQGNNHD